MTRGRNRAKGTRSGFAGRFPDAPAAAQASVGVEPLNATDDWNGRLRFQLNFRFAALTTAT